MGCAMGERHDSRVVTKVGCSASSSIDAVTLLLVVGATGRFTQSSHDQISVLFFLGGKKENSNN